MDDFERRLRESLADAAIETDSHPAPDQGALTSAGLALPSVDRPRLLVAVGVITGLVASAGALSLGMGREPVGGASHPSPTVPATVDARAIVYVGHAGFWGMGHTPSELRLWRPDGASVDPQYQGESISRRLSQYGSMSSPRFRNAGEVSLQVVDHDTGRHALDLFDLKTGQRERLVEAAPAEQIFDCAWHPDGDLVACVEGTASQHHVSLHDIADGSVKRIRTMTLLAGGSLEPSTDAHVSVTWSKSGASVLVVDHFAATRYDPDTSRHVPGDSIFVIDIEGHDIAPPTRGAWATWSADEHSIIMRTIGEEPASWFELDLDTGERSPIAMHPEGIAAARSPDGRFIAYAVRNPPFADPWPGRLDDVRIFDTFTGSDNQFATGFTYHVWLGDSVLAAVKTRGCPKPAKDGMVLCTYGGAWQHDGTWQLSLSGDRTRLPILDEPYGSVGVWF